MENTERLALPLLAPGQAQKEMLHNEALQLVDILLAPAVVEPPRDDPPQGPVAGECYIAGDAPTAEWSGYPHHICAYTSAGWRFAAPAVGLRAFVISTGTYAQSNPAGWTVGELTADRLVIEGNQVVGPQAGAIAAPADGTTTDVEARATIGEILAALRQHGLISS